MGSISKSAKLPHGWISLVFAAICAISLILLVAIADTAHADDCDSSLDCCRLDDCSAYTRLPTAAECEEDDCACAQWVECYLRNQDPDSNWPLIPDGAVQLNRNFFHDRFFETRISPGAYDDWLLLADSSGSSVSLPDQTVLYKNGYLPDSDDASQPQSSPAATFVMVKLSGYCPDGNTVAGYCLGDDWFTLEITDQTYGLVSSGSLLDYGKEKDCLYCHSGAAADGDWMWQLSSGRRFK